MGGLRELRAVQVVLTSGCNLRCAYCYQNRRRRLRMSWTVARAAVDLLLRSRRRELSLALMGGEPLLEFGLFRRVIEYAADARPAGTRLKLSTTTNGTLLDEAKAAFLAEHDVRTTLSFDGVPAAQELRGPGTFAILDGLLDRLRRTHPAFYRERLEVSMTLTGSNLASLSGSVRYFLRKGVGKIVVLPRVTHDPDWRPEEIVRLDREFARVHRVCLRHLRETGQAPLQCLRDGGESSGRRPRRLSMCSAGDGRELAVDVDGQVHGCVLFASSYQVFPPGLLPGRLKTMRLGDVRDPALGRRLARYRRAAQAAEIFDGKEKKHSSYGRCGECRYIESCYVCPMSIGYAPGNTDPSRVPDLPCAWNLITGKYRDRFPRAPRPIDLITGRVQLPGRIQALLALGAPKPRAASRTRD